MNSLAILVVTATLGVDYGWHHTPDGQLEYLIQIEPGLVRSLENGVDVTSEMMPEVRGNVRRFRISVGTGPLPRETIVQTSAQSPAQSATKKPADAPTTPADPQANAKSWNQGDNIARPEIADNPGGGAGPIVPHRTEPDRVDPSSGRPIEQAAAKPPGDGGGSAESPSDSPSSEMNRLSSSDDKPAVSDETSTSPWLVGTIVALCASLGANFYQGINLKSARRRYYQLVDRLGLRTMPGSEGISIEGR
jgi:hypothetical protein